MAHSSRNPPRTPSSAGATAAPRQRPARNPEPQPQRILQCLAGMQEAHAAGGGRWMEARAAAAWVSKQLGAAEALWERTAGGVEGGDRGDYCLLMTSEEDEEFFMTDYAQE